jgi:hypothetical protein
MRATRRVGVTLVLSLLVFAPVAQQASEGQVGGQVVGLPQPPTRDQPPPRTGSSAIAGTITAADTGLPMRHAVVMLQPQGSPGERRTMLADVGGAFEFRNLPSGAYSLRVEPGASGGRYVGASYGGGGGAATAKPIVLKDGERFARANIALPRAGAIEGRVVDDFGEPVARVPVYPMRVTGGGSSFSRSGPGMQTDDLGRFRLYGLAAADYIVAADSRGMGSMGMPVTEGETEGFATTYYPSALGQREAMRVRITSGAEVIGLQIQLVRMRSFRISGTVVDSHGRPVQRPNIMLMRVTERDSTGGGSQMDAPGRFTFRNVMPGEYRLVVRPSGPPPWALQGPDGSGAQAPAVSREYASVPIVVSGDVDDLLVVTSPGVSVSGRVVFAEGPPEKPLPIRIATMPSDRMMPMGPSASAMVDAEGRFMLDEVVGPVRIRPQQVPQGYALESVRVGGRDITDEPFEFRPSHSGHVELVLTGRVGRLEGQVTGDDGAPAMSVVVVLLPDDKSLWRSGSSRMRTTVPRDGRFTLNAILPGGYLVVAVAQEDFAAGPDPAPEFYEMIAKEATSVYLAEGETRTVTLRTLPRR